MTYTLHYYITHRNWNVKNFLNLLMLADIGDVLGKETRDENCKFKMLMRKGKVLMCEFEPRDHISNCTFAGSRAPNRVLNERI